MKVSLTGATGSIGAYVLRDLKARGHDVDSSGAMFADADVVIHAAATRYRTESGPFELIREDIQMTRSALERTRGRFVFLSSGTVYENTPGDWTEQAALVMPTSPIPVAKVACEAMVRAWTEETGRPHTIWRLFNVVSPREPHDRPGHVQVDLFRKIFVDRVSEVSVMGARQFTWVGDVSDAIAAFAGDKRADNETMNLGNRTLNSVAGLAHAMIDHSSGLLHSSPVVHAGSPIADIRKAEARMGPDVSKVMRLLGWRAKTQLGEMAEQFVRAKMEGL